MPCRLTINDPTDKNFTIQPKINNLQSFERKPLLGAPD